MSKDMMSLMAAGYSHSEGPERNFILLERKKS